MSSKPDKTKASLISGKLLAWYDKNKRDLPWRRETDPYRVWLSEVMLQQTRVEAAIPYYRRFLEKYPDLALLAGAQESDVLKLWEGLGYYSRARHFLSAVREVRDTYGGAVPEEPDIFRSLPGVGSYTGAAVGSIAFQKPLAVVDGNVRRVLCRLFSIEGDVKKKKTEQAVQDLADLLLDRSRPGDYNQAIMELGALVCIPGKPRCGNCPVTDHCLAKAEGKAEFLPERRQKRKLPVAYLAAGLVKKDGKILVRQRTEGRLLRGLWEFPAIEVKEGEDTEVRLRDLFGPGAVVGRRVAELAHTFSHLRWEISVYEVTAFALPSGRPWLWADGGELERLAFPAVYASLVGCVKEKCT